MKFLLLMHSEGVWEGGFFLSLSSARAFPLQREKTVETDSNWYKSCTLCVIVFAYDYSYHYMRKHVAQDCNSLFKVCQP